MTTDTELTASGAVGQRWRRSDDVAKVRGQLRYTADEKVHVVVHGAFHRSLRPHARLVAIDTEAAKAYPGVLAVVTGADLHDALGDAIFTGPAFSDQPPLAYERVRFVGEPVAAVLAEDLATARAAADLIGVEYEELPAILDADAALEARAYVHEELRPSSVFEDLAHLRGVRETNVNYEFRLRRGNAEAALQSGRRVEGEFVSPPIHHVPIELPRTVAWREGDRLEIVTTTQTPSYVRQMAADLVGIPLAAVRVRAAPLGGGFGSKMYDRLEPAAAALTWVTGYPVQLAVTREEAFLLTTRHGARVRASMALGEDGSISAAQADIVYDTGAYADVGPRITAKSGMIAPGPYRVEHVDVRSRCVYTNKPSAGPFRGFGVPQLTFAHESLVDELARAVGEDPVAFRRRNLLREGDLAPVGTAMHSADFLACLDAVAEAIGWDDPFERPSGRYRRGRGVAVGVKAVLTPTVSNAVLQLNQDGSASLAISTVDMGQGSDTIMAQIVAEVLGLGAGAVRVVQTDTDVTPYDTITAGSRSTYHTGNAVRLAAEKMRDRLVTIAARRFGVAETDVKLGPDGLLASTTQERLSLSELVRGYFGARGTTLSTEAGFATEWIPYDHETGQSSRVTEHWFAGAVGAVITVDTATGRIALEHLAVAGDVGRAINPALVEQQLCGAAIMGIGLSLFEEMVFDEGQLVNGSMLDYQLPSLRDMPSRLTPLIIESPHRGGPFGAKGVGETGILPVAPAIANALRDAVDVRLTRLPLTPERVLQAIGGLS